MDIRLEVLRVDGVWTVTQSGPNTTSYPNQREAILAAIDAAKRHNQSGSGHASVHHWQGGHEEKVFDTRSDPKTPS